MEGSEVKDWQRLVTRVARATAKDFPDSLIEDLEQALWESILSAQKHGKLMTPYERHIESNLFYAARTAAWKERKEHLTISPQYGYRTSDVRSLFETYFEKEKWESAKIPDDAKSELGHVGVEMSSDLARAWKVLSIDYKRVIFFKFALNEKVDSRKLSKALARVADILNTYHPNNIRKPGPGNRPIISNVAAKYILDTQYDPRAGA